MPHEDETGEPESGPDLLRSLRRQPDIDLPSRVSDVEGINREAAEGQRRELQRKREAEDADHGIGLGFRAAARRLVNVLGICACIFALFGAGWIVVLVHHYLSEALSDPARVAAILGTVVEWLIAALFGGVIAHAIDVMRKRP